MKDDGDAKWHHFFLCLYNQYMGVFLTIDNGIASNNSSSLIQCSFGKDLRECRVTTTSIQDFYVLAAQEAIFNAHNYYDARDSNGAFTRSDASKRFHIYAGKLAEFEVMRILKDRYHDEIIEGVRLFGKTHDGDNYDLVFKKFGKVQVKYLSRNKFKKFTSAELDSMLARYSDCKIIYASSEDFDRDNRPTSDINRRSDFGNQLDRKYSWNLYEVDLKKMIKLKITEIDFRKTSSLNYVAFL